MTTELLIRSFLYNDRSITVPFTGEAFFNATVAAKAFDKLPKDWLRNKETQEYMDALGATLTTEEDQLVIVRQGGAPNEQGTWLHPKLVVAFARWLHPKFAVWCDMQVEEILRGNRGVAAMPAPVASGYYEMGKSYIEAVEANQKILVSASLYERISRARDGFEQAYLDTVSKLVEMQNKHIALLEKLAKRGIKP